MSEINKKRQPLGQPTGGEFAQHERGDADLSLGAPRPSFAASGINGPDGPYTVTGYKAHNTRNGVAFAAKLRRDGKIVGDIENDGNGGMTFVHYSNREESALFGTYVKAWGGLKVYDVSPYEEEDVADALITEFECSRALNGKFKAGKVPFLRAGEDPREGYRYISNPGSTTEALVQKVRETELGGRVWDGSRWVHTGL